jgi:hypothetical protein
MKRLRSLVLLTIRCPFHRLVIIGRGITDFDEATVTKAFRLKLLA